MMQTNAFRPAISIRHAVMIMLCGACIFTSSGCSSPFRSQARPSQPHLDPKAQQYYYDKGVQHYARENFGEAKAAFRRVIDAGPNTPLGMKAQENLKKIQQILKTVEDIESK